MKRPAFLEKLRKDPILFDGAMGTLLMEEGLPPGTPPEIWNVERPDVVKGIHARYLEAGANVITANTFGANPMKLGKFGLEERCDEINAAGLRLARETVDEFGRAGSFVACDLGTTGQYFPPVGTLEEGAAAEAFLAQVESLLRGGADCFLVETMTHLKEAEILIRTAREVTNLPLGVTLTYDKKPRGYFTIMGDKPAEAVKALAGAGADFVGANCTLGPEDMAGLAEILVAESEVPVLVQPNAGLPELVEGRAVYHVTPSDFARAVTRILDAGVTAVGGCCGTEPAHIRAVSELLNSYRPICDS
ncbi:MAG: homocysteine S-methyltransferase family protein [Planctomycetota bacterium]